MDIVTILAIAGSVVMAASAVTAMLPTPDPNTVWGKVYRAIEIAGLVVGKAKQGGIIKGNTRIDKLVSEMHSKKEV